MIIGISGFKQSGKDTVARMLQYLSLSDYSYVRTNQLTFDKSLDYLDTESKWEIVRFADKVKDLVCTLIDCGRGDLERENFKNTPALYQYTPRQLLQLIGTDFGRNIIAKNIWIDLTLKSYNSNKHWIIPDVRFKNELEVIKNLGGINIRVIRDIDSNDRHESERDLDDSCQLFDYTIDNTSDKDTLLCRVHSISHILFNDL